MKKINQLLLESLALANIIVGTASAEAVHSQTCHVSLAEGSEATNLILDLCVCMPDNNSGCGNTCCNNTGCQCGK